MIFTDADKRTPILALSLALCSLPAFAQQESKTKIQPPFTLETEWRTRVEEHTLTDFNQINTNDPRDEFNRVRFGMRWRDRSGLNVYFQPQYSYGHNTQALVPTGTTHDFDVHQAYLELPVGGQKVRVGRQELIFGDERLIGAGNWGNQGRSFDALRWTRPGGKSTTDFFVGKLGQASGKTSEPVLSGLYSTFFRGKSAVQDLYLLYKADHAGGNNQDIWTTGTRYKIAFARHFDATTEAAFQFGRFSGRAMSAYAYSTNVGYTFPGRAGFRVAVERNFASGGNPTGKGDYHTFDQLFPTNHSFYGLVDYVGWRNMENWRLSFKGNVSPRVSVALDGHLFGLADATDSWYSDNGKPIKGANGKTLRDATGASGRDIGAEIDLTLSYAVNKQLGLTFGVGHFMPGSFVRNANGGHADASDWFFVQPTYRF